MTEGHIVMKHQEIDRFAVIQDVVAGRLRQAGAAAQLKVSVRQLKRLVRRYRHAGAAGLVSQHRGKPPNNRISRTVRADALHRVRECYADFSPTFAHQKLTELHGVRFSVETLRQWMIMDGLWRAKGRSAVRLHPRRPRRARRGELVQIDGSPHDGFEGRGPYWEKKGHFCFGLTYLAHHPTVSLSDE